jgi:hypothetical protein
MFACMDCASTSSSLLWMQEPRSPWSLRTKCSYISRVMIGNVHMGTDQTIMSYFAWRCLRKALAYCAFFFLSLWKFDTTVAYLTEESSRSELVRILDTMNSYGAVNGHHHALVRFRSGYNHLYPFERSQYAYYSRFGRCRKADSRQCYMLRPSHHVDFPHAVVSHWLIQL